ncbi:anti-sigma B factor antagonist [Lysobacteraceae bacterium NML07-0707]|nr:anti-sigma B factor antagonist [Xanthomonadaceae bacterium NML07-0707]
MPTDALNIERREKTLVFRGALTRPTAAAAWQQASALLAGIEQLDIAAASAVDSSGMALLAALSARLPNAQIIGQPAGFIELRDAYRLDAQLQMSVS